MRCPYCDSVLLLITSYVDGVAGGSGTPALQWDEEYECPSCGVVFEYRVEFPEGYYVWLARMLAMGKAPSD